MKRLIVQALEGACTALHRAFPKVYWCRWFANWSARLDERWQTGVWRTIPPDEEEE